MHAGEDVLDPGGVVLVGPTGPSSALPGTALAAAAVCGVRVWSRHRGGAVTDP